ncbi:unnamed protein product [Arctia plantaginis]|uniref:Uncharacterized protein n=1 Tax=Arctia plantaginis TaxID=874455 RepID=A0A8S1BEP9_ARCPL|nr:unnamed protein product [Arctia plantaginis]
MSDSNPNNKKVAKKGKSMGHKRRLPDNHRTAEYGQPKLRNGHEHFLPRACFCNISTVSFGNNRFPNLRSWWSEIFLRSPAPGPGASTAGGESDCLLQVPFSRPFPENEMTDAFLLWT